MKRVKKISFRILILVFAAAVCLCSRAAVYADDDFSISPMNQKIVLAPGETYEGAFNVTNPVTNQNDFSYVVAVTPFYVDDNHELIYQNNGDYNQMIDWITVDDSKGVIAPNVTKEIHFSIKVPEDAPAGGQYAAITVTSNRDETPQENAINIHAKYSIAHLIYAEIAGTTKRQGEIFNANVPSFILDGDISAVSSVKNTGNVHSSAKYTLKIFPLFSGEEVFTNEEDPQSMAILPGRTYTNSIAWDGTPLFGMFNIEYTVEFEGMTTQVTKLVIKCPLWLLAIIIVVIAGIVLWIVVRSRSRKKAAKNAEN